MEFRLFLFCCLFVFAACSKKSKTLEIDILAHGGSGFYSDINPFPPNSLPAIEKGLGNPAIDGIEVDVQCSRDTQMWLYHDNNLQFFCDVNRVLWQMTTAELEEVQFQKPKNNFSPILTLDQLISLSNAHPERKVRVQLKADTAFCFEAFLPKDFPAQFSFSLSSWENYIRLREKYPERTWLTSNQLDLVNDYFKARLPYGMELDFNAVSKNGVRLMINNGLKISLYGMRGMEDYSIIQDWQMHEVQVDNVTQAIHGLNIQ